MFVDIAGGDQELYDSDLQFERQAVNFYQDTDPTAKREDEVRPIMTRSPLGANVMPADMFQCHNSSMLLQQPYPQQ